MKYILYIIQYRFDYVKEAFDIIKLLKLSNDNSYLNILITFYSIVFQNEIYIIQFTFYYMYYTMYNLLHVLYNLHSITCIIQFTFYYMYYTIYNILHVLYVQSIIHISLCQRSL
jgi:hypothetical protein